MIDSIKTLAGKLREALGNTLRRSADTLGALRPGPNRVQGVLGRLQRTRDLLIVLAALAGAGYLVFKHPPMQTVERGEIGIRVNQLNGEVSQWQGGKVLVLPLLHEMRIYSLRDQTYRPAQLASASGPAPLQSIEGLSLGLDLAVRYALDPARLAAVSRNLPDDFGADIVEPAVQGVVYKVFARHTVREIFSSKRVEIQQSIEADLKARLAVEGILLKSVLIGKVDLPENYKRGMESLLAEELATEKMRHTLEFKAKQVQATEIDAQAAKVRREVNAEAAAREQVIAAKAQEEAMKHVLPFKQRQIEQRQLEAEAEKQSRVKAAEGNAQARRIEAAGEADARQKLAEAEAFRVERVGKANAEQMAREGLVISQHPLLIQKTMADKLSDKIQVIIAAPPTDGGFIGNALLGSSQRQGAVPAQAGRTHTQAVGAAKAED